MNTLLDRGTRFRAFRLMAQTLLMSMQQLPAASGEQRQAASEPIDAFVNSRIGTIDYESCSLSYTQRYLLKNYWKVAHVFLEVPLPARSASILDIGSGAGSAAWAALVDLDSQSNGSRAIDVHLLDRSRAQLRLADSLASQVSVNLPDLSVSYTSILGDILSWDAPPASFDVVLLSYVLGQIHSEEPSGVGRALNAAAETLNAGGVIYVIERKDDAVWPEIIECPLFSSLGAGTLSIQTADFRDTLPDPWQQREIISARYMVLK